MVDAATTVLRVFGGDDDVAAFQGDEVLQRGLATLAGGPGQDKRTAPLANCEHSKWAMAGRITQHGGIDTTALSTIESVALDWSALGGSGRVKPPEL